MKFEDTNLLSTSIFPYLSHHLQELHLDVESMQSRVELAVQLDRTFPMLSTISVKGWYDENIACLIPQMIATYRNEWRPVK
jgi:hypothetical protein